MTRPRGVSCPLASVVMAPPPLWTERRCPTSCSPSTRWSRRPRDPPGPAAPWRGLSRDRARRTRRPHRRRRRHPSRSRPRRRRERRHHADRPDRRPSPRRRHRDLRRCRLRRPSESPAHPSHRRRHRSSRGSSRRRLLRTRPGRGQGEGTLIDEARGVVAACSTIGRPRGVPSRIVCTASLPWHAWPIARSLTR